MHSIHIGSNKKVTWHENFNLSHIIMPVIVQKFKNMLTEVNYNPKKANYLISGFSEQFSNEYEGDWEVKWTSPNLKFRIRDKFELWEKVLKEVIAGRYAGPFEEIPFEYYIQSPIGLVPKDKGKKRRLIFHLSYPRGGDHISVNQGIDHEKCTVRYPDFDQAVKLCLINGVNCSISKANMSMAFRHVSLSPCDWFLLTMKAYHPITGKVYYFIDKCLPFGSSINCKIFQEFSNAISFIVEHRTKKPNINYLDDFLFVAMLKAICDQQLQAFWMFVPR